MNIKDDNEEFEILELVDIDDETESSSFPLKQEEILEEIRNEDSEENFQANSDKKNQENVEENIKENAEENIKENAEENAEENVEENSKENLEENPKENLKENSEILEEMKRNSKKKKNKINRVITYVRRTAITLLLTIVILLGGIYSVMCMLVYGPSPTAKELFVMSVKETSAIGFLANWFFTEEQVKEIIDRNSIKDTNEVTDTSLVEVSVTNNISAAQSETPAIEVIDIKGGTFRGKLMIVKDPSRVFVGTVPTFTEGDGFLVSEMAKNNNAIGGINGGEFVDGDTTYSGMPVGLVMTKGNIISGDKTSMNHVTGFTKDNILVVGNMTGQQALNMNMRDCVNIRSDIGPFLIINGTPQEVDGVGGGINPRSAIGQRADGAVLLLVVDGRQANTLGASFADLIYIMQQYGAVNASTMDGGTSTQMYYEGEVINTPYSPTGPRRCPTSFLVGGIN